VIRAFAEIPSCLPDFRDKTFQIARRSHRTYVIHDTRIGVRLRELYEREREREISSRRSQYRSIDRAVSRYISLIVAKPAARVNASFSRKLARMGRRGKERA
jgi:hypothetical protein